MSTAGAPAPLPSVLLRLTWGATLLAAPGPLLQVASQGRPPDTRHARAIVRILGTRHLGQSILEVSRPTALVFAGCAAADALHAASALTLAAHSPAWRRPALLAVAVSAGLGLAAVGQAHARCTKVGGDYS
jgi:hypothetical protein